MSLEQIRRRRLMSQREFAAACRAFTEAMLPLPGSPEEKALLLATHWPSNLAMGALRQEAARSRAALAAEQRGGA